MKRMRIRKDDQVKVVGGKDRGKTGRVLRTDPKRRKVYVEGLNIVKRHERPRSVKDASRGGEVGGIVEKEGPIHVSNVMPCSTPKTTSQPGSASAATVTSASATRSEPAPLSTDGSRSPSPDSPRRRRACASATSRRSCRR